MATFHAYFPGAKLPTVDTLTRALSSRGFVFDLDGDTPLNERSGDLGLSVDGNKVGATVVTIQKGSPEWNALTQAADDRADGETLLKVLKNCALRVSVTAEGDDARWVRDFVRGAALLAVGAYENESAGTLLFYGG